MIDYEPKPRLTSEQLERVLLTVIRQINEEKYGKGAYYRLVDSKLFPWATITSDKGGTVGCTNMGVVFIGNARNGFGELVNTLFEEALSKITSNEDIASPYPHVCGRCGSPAYIGFSSVDCSRKCGA